VAAAHDARAERLVVRTFDNAGIAHGEMIAARSAADAILQDAGLTLDWRDCSSGCADVPGPAEILLRIVRAPRGAAAGSLGYSLVNIETGSGTLATVFADRIASAAARTQIEGGVLLGRAIAHEIGHLLLGTSRHADSGLMRARWSDRELKRDTASDWKLTSEVVAQLARRPRARLASP
jgi:hypothetical protein